MQDNLEFLQWIKRFWDQNYPGHEYDPDGRRRGQGVAPPPLHGSTARTTAAPAAAAPRRAVPATAAPAARARAAPAVGTTARVARPAGSAAAPQAVVPDETIQALTAQMDEMKVSVDSLERERDFYFNKVRRPLCNRRRNSNRSSKISFLFPFSSFDSCVTLSSWFKNVFHSSKRPKTERNTSRWAVRRKKY